MTLIEKYLLLYYSKKEEIFHRKTSIKFLSIYHYSRTTLKMSLPWNKTFNMVDKKKYNDISTKGQGMVLEKVDPLYYWPAQQG